MSQHLMAVMWYCNGLEAIADITEVEQNMLFETLRTGSKPRHYQVPNLMHWRLRAQANPQRHYEIYLLNATEGIGADDIREAFEASPQTMADTVRRIGHKFYSDRASEREVKIR